MAHYRALAPPDAGMFHHGTRPGVDCRQRRHHLLGGRSLLQRHIQRCGLSGNDWIRQASAHVIRTAVRLEGVAIVGRDVRETEYIAMPRSHADGGSDFLSMPNHTTIKASTLRNPHTCRY